MIKLENNHLIARIAGLMQYQHDMRNISSQAPEGRLQTIMKYADETVAAIEKRIDKLIEHIGDAEATLILFAAEEHLGVIRTERQVREQKKGSKNWNRLMQAKSEKQRVMAYL